MSATVPRQCQVCHSTVSDDDIVNRRAGLVAGVLLCAGCVERKRQEILAQQHATAHAAPVARAVAAPVGAAHGDEVGSTAGGIYIPPVHDGMKDVADESLSLIGDDERVTGSTQIRSFATGSTLAGHHDDSHYKRPLSPPNAPASRVRTFHAKLTEASMAHLDEQVNEWLDANPDIYIKSSTSSVGVFEGKSKETHLILTLFY